MENSKPIVEGGAIPKPDKMKIIKVMRSKSFMNYRKDLEKQGIKVEFATSPFAYYKLTHRKWGKNSDGKERAIYITSKQNVGDDAEYISNDNIAMGELNENSQESMFNKMKTKAEIKELVKEVVTEIMAENHNFKVGDEVKFNGNYDGVVVKVHTSGKLKGHIDVQKKGRTSTVTLYGGDKREVRLAEAITEEMHDCIQDYMGMGYSYSEAMKKCKGSVWDEKGGRSRKRMKREDISEEGGANINVNALSPTEQQLAVGLINTLGHGSHPMADVKGLKYFKVDYLADIVAKNKSRLRGDVKKHVAKILKKLSSAMAEAEIDEGSKWLKYSDLLLAKSRAVEKFGPESKEVQKIDKEIKKEMDKLGIHESLINESKDVAFVLDQLANAVDLYPKDEFAQHMASQTKFDEKTFEKLYDAYFKMKAMDRFHMATDISKSKKFLRKFGIKEEVQTINEGLWTGIKTRESGVKGWKGNIFMAWGSGTSFQQILWLISPKKGHLSRYQWDADGNIKQNQNHADGFDTGQYGLKLFYEHNKDAGLDIEKDFPFKEVNRMRKAYRRLPVETQVKMATDTTHKLAMNFLAKYGIKP